MTTLVGRQKRWYCLSQKHLMVVAAVVAVAAVDLRQMASRMLGRRLTS